MPTIAYDTDVLIIGAGAAGLSAAIEAARAGADVLLIAKGPLTMTGITPLGIGGYSAVTGINREDSCELHFQDSVTAGRYLCDQNLVEVMTRDGGESITKLRQFGLVFQKQNGQLLLRQTPGMSRARTLRVPGGGRRLSAVLKKELGRYSNSRVKTDVAVTDLLVNGEEVVGALAYDLKSGSMLAIHARATILATGGKARLWPHTDCPPESSGDGLLLAYHAGAELIDLEQELFYPTVVVHPEQAKGLEVSYEPLLRAGAQIMNRRGQDIAPHTDVLPTRDQLANLIFTEIKEGRGTEHGAVRVDLRHATENRKAYVREFLPAYGRLKNFGIDITEEIVEVAPAAHTSLGGVRIDADTRTKLPRLFAVGEVTGGLHGANRLAGQSWLGCVVFGLRAGRFAAALAREGEGTPLEQRSLRKAEDALARFLEPKTGRRRPFEVLREINSIMWEFVGLRRTAAMMEMGLARIEALRDEVQSGGLSIDTTPGFNLECSQALQVRSLLLAGEMLTRAALFRQESRGTHFREDFPQQDDARWLVHTMVRKEGARMHVGSAPIVLNRLRP